ncbi:MAG: hypothetical protein AAF732_17120 [Pseudomonadota bacterium]
MTEISRNARQKRQRNAHDETTSLSEVLLRLGADNLSVDVRDTRLVRLARDLLNAKSVLAFGASEQPLPISSAVSPATSPSPISAADYLAYAACKSVTRCSSAHAELGHERLVVPLVKDERVASLRFLIVELGPSTPFSTALAYERLELLAALYRALSQGRETTSPTHDRMDDLQIIADLCRREPRARRNQKLIDAVARSRQLKQLAIARIHPSAEVVAGRTVFRVEGRLVENETPGMRAKIEGLARVDNGSAPLGWLMIRDVVSATRGYFWV